MMQVTKMPTLRAILWRISLLILFLAYLHIVIYPFLEQLLPPPGGKLLTFLIIGLVSIAIYMVAFKLAIKRFIPREYPFLFFSLFILNALFSIINMTLYFGTVDFIQFATGFYLIALPPMLAIVLYISVGSIKQVHAIVRIIASLNFIIALSGFITYLLGDTWILFLLQLPHIEKLPLHYGGTLRMTSIIWNPLYFGILMALNSILSLNMLLYCKEWRVLWFTSFLFSGLGVIASFTRTAWVVLLVGGIVTIFLVKHKISRKIVQTGLIVGVTLIVVLKVPLPQGNYHSVLEAIVDHIRVIPEGGSSRIENLEVNANRILSNPIGYGLGTAGYSALPSRASDSIVVFTSYLAADNNYLSIALQTGIQGVLFFLLAQMSALIRIVKSIKQVKDGFLRAVLGTSTGWIVGMMVGALFLNVWEYNLIPYIVYAFLGMSLKIVALNRLQQRVDAENNL